MARKKVDLNKTAPLQSVMIGKIKTHKFGWLGALILIGMFGGIIYYLPELNPLYQKYIGSDPAIKNETNPNNETEKPEEEPAVPAGPVEDTIHKFSDTKEYTLNDLRISDINLDNGILNFKLANIGNNDIDLENDNMYFVVYDDKENVLHNIALTYKLAMDDTKENTYNINSNGVNFKITKISEENYPVVDLNNGNETNATMTCSNTNERLFYTFNDNKLTRIRHTANYSEEEAKNYSEKNAEFAYLFNKYNKNINGISIVYTGETNINFRMIIDYSIYDSTLDYSEFNNKNRLYFAKDVAPSLIKFRLESYLYTCN